MIPDLSEQKIIEMMLWAEDPDHWVVSPPVTYPAALSHYGMDIAYTIRYNLRHHKGKKEGIGSLPLRHLLIDYTNIVESMHVPLFMDSTIKAFRMNDYSILKTEDRCVHVFQRLFCELPFGD